MKICKSTHTYLILCASHDLFATGKHITWFICNEKAKKRSHQKMNCGDYFTPWVLSSTDMHTHTWKHLERPRNTISIYIMHDFSRFISSYWSVIHDWVHTCYIVAENGPMLMPVCPNRSNFHKWFVPINWIPYAARKRSAHSMTGTQHWSEEEDKKGANGNDEINELRYPGEVSAELNGFWKSGAI